MIKISSEGRKFFGSAKSLGRAKRKVKPLGAWRRLRHSAVDSGGVDERKVVLLELYRKVLHVLLLVSRASMPLSRAQGDGMR